MAIYPEPHQVLSGVVYGPNDNDFVGILQTEYENLESLLNSLKVNYSFSTASLPSVYNQNINIFKGTDWNFNVSGIGSEASGFYFTIKSSKSLEDSQSELQVYNSTVLTISGSSYNIQSGSLTFLDQDGGIVQVQIDPEVTSRIPSGNKFVWDLKGINETTVRAFGFINIKEDITNEY